MGTVSSLTLNRSLGALVGSGYINVSGLNIKINNCYSGAKVIGEANKGSIIGGLPSNLESATITNCSYNEELNPNMEAIGLNELSDDKLTISNLSSVNNKTKFQVGANYGDENNIYYNKTIAGLDFSFNIKNQQRALSTIDKVDKQLEIINNKLAEIGSTMNRFDSILEAQSITIENLSSANSVIKDADIATVSASMVKANILKNAGASLMQQSNITQQTALNLINNAVGR